MKVIKFYVEFGGNLVQLPVNPEALTISTGSNDKTEETINLGEITIPKLRKLKSISFSSFFPYDAGAPYANGGSIRTPQYYVDFFNTIQESIDPVRLVITEFGINMLCRISSFSNSYKGGTNDVEYTVTFTEYKTISIQETSVSIMPRQQAVLSAKTVEDTVKVVKEANKTVENSAKVVTNASKITNEQVQTLTQKTTTAVKRPVTSGQFGINDVVGIIGPVFKTSELITVVKKSDKVGKITVIYTKGKYPKKYRLETVGKSKNEIIGYAPASSLKAIPESVDVSTTAKLPSWYGKR